MKMKIAFTMICVTLMTATVFAGAAQLRLSGHEITPGATQKLTVTFNRAGVYDLFLILSGPGGRFNCLKPDGAFASAKKAVPFLKGIKVRKPGKIELHSWRVVDLAPATYRWSVVLTRTGAGLLDKTNRLGLDTRSFRVKKESATGIFSELREPSSRHGNGRGLAGALDFTKKSGKGYGGPGHLALDKAEADGETGSSPARRRAGKTKAMADEKERCEAMPPGSPARPASWEKNVAASGPAPGKFRLPKADYSRKTSLTAQGQSRTLTAGQSDDNKDFKSFISFLRRRNRPQVMAMDVSQRRFITVLDSRGRHVPNADVEIVCGNDIVYTGRTYANGQTMFCPSAVDKLQQGKTRFIVSVRKGMLESQYDFEVQVVKEPGLKNLFDPASLPRPTPPMDMPHPVIPLYRKGLEAKDRLAVAGAAKRAAAVDETRAPTIGRLDWLEDSGDSSEQETTGETVERKPAEKAVGDWILRLPATVTPTRPHLDLVFQIDTTGSMGDEIRSIQTTLDSVAARIDDMTPRPLVRWGLVLYGDKGDVYTVRRYGFTNDTAVFRKRIMNIQMTGGGDTPEAALEGLDAAISHMEWDTGNAIRLIFLISDAPPHLDYGRPYTYVGKMKEAISKGIKIYPVAASGLNKQGEYIYRQLAQATMGRFLFITYGAGTRAGGPAGKTPHEVRQPQKRNNLDDIIVQTVGSELKNWTSPEFYIAGSSDTQMEHTIPGEEGELF